MNWWRAGTAWQRQHFWQMSAALVTPCMLAWLLTRAWPYLPYFGALYRCPLVLCLLNSRRFEAEGSRNFGTA
jgi:hypothetical protein